MTETEKGRRSDALHYDSCLSRRELCDMIARYEDRIAELADENAKLRELAKLMHDTIKDLQVAFDASVVVGGVELSAEYFETEYLRGLGIEVTDA